MEKFIKLIVVLAVVLAAILIIALIVLNQQPVPEQIACTADAKLCPDGSAVGRIAPNCEFAECPAIIEEPVVCPTDVKTCWDNTIVSRKLPDCEFEECPPEPNCPAEQYPSLNCNGECGENQECKNVTGSQCYVCASKVPNCYEWGMFPNNQECASICFSPNWCELNDLIGTVCWRCREPYDYR